MKYPLTDAAKSAARILAEAWRSDEVDQTFRITFVNENGHDRPIFMGQSSIDGKISAASYFELNRFGLLEMEDRGRNWRVLLLQELANAVDRDFEVSDFFLTMNAVGNIIVNSTTGSVQGVGHNTGNVSQSMSGLADQLTNVFGVEFLGTQQELRDAIEDLRQSTERDKPSKVGRFILQLGRLLEHGANFATVMLALQILMQSIK